MNDQEAANALGDKYYKDQPEWKRPKSDAQVLAEHWQQKEHQHRFTVAIEWGWKEAKSYPYAPSTPGRKWVTKLMCAECDEVKEIG